MDGQVDDQLRALIPIQVSATDVDEIHEIIAWVDTAFNGSLVIPKTRIDELELTQESSAEAMLADGHKVELETFGCWVEWFGTRYHTQVVMNDSNYALLGTILLDGHRLEIDYTQKSVALL